MRLLDAYCLLAGLVCVAGLAARAGRLLAVAARLYPLPAPAREPGQGGRPRALFRLAIGPLSFCGRANPTWSVGCIAYHLAITTVALSYLASLGCLILRVAQGRAIPDIISGSASWAPWHPASLMAVILGNSEPVAARFLFGEAGRAFRLCTHVEVVFALVGNACLLCTLLRRRMGAVLRDLDSASSGLRRDGRFSLEHLLVRSVIFSIIQTELVARLGLWPPVVYLHLHVFLAMTFLMVMPFSYLAHIFYAPVALWLAYRRRRHHVIA